MEKGLRVTITFILSVLFFVGCVGPRPLLRSERKNEGINVDPVGCVRDGGDEGTPMLDVQFN